MGKQVILIVILALLLIGVGAIMLAGSAVSQAAPPLQETETPRPTPTVISEPTSAPEPTKKPSKPKPPSQPSSPSPTPVPEAVTSAAAESARVPSAGLRRTVGWSLGITGAVLACTLVIVRYLRKRNPGG